MDGFLGQLSFNRITWLFFLKNRQKEERRAAEGPAVVQARVMAAWASLVVMEVVRRSWILDII